MKQVDFDETLRQMRMDHYQATVRIKKMIADMDLELAEKCKALSKMQVEYQEMKTQKALLHKELNRIDTEHGAKYREFVRENQGHVSRQLEDVSEWALVNELASRGYYLRGGGIYHPDQAEEWLHNLNMKLTPKNESDDNSKDQ